MAHSFLEPASRCEYLPDRLWQLRYEIAPAMTRTDYSARMNAGWRRFGPILFRPECPECRMCQSLRVPVETFRPAEGQRRAWRKNAGDLELRVGDPVITDAKQALLDRFRQHGHETKGWPPAGEQVGMELFVRNPFSTEEWTYWLGDRLLAAGYVDVLPDGLSAIYFFWEPGEARRSLGTYNILRMIAEARARGLRHVYLGYHVQGCRSLEYKARFRPHEILGPDRTWTLVSSR
jgi:arginine-tRNA-protein transferase